MVNRSKSKGTSMESACVKWFRMNGFPHADRQPLRGNRDAGDIALTAGCIAETKSYAGPPSLGQPSAGVLAEWLRQTEVEQNNAGAAVALLIVKRSGTTDPARFWCYLTMSTLGWLLNAPVDPPGPDAPVCMSLASATALLRAAGFGTPLEEEPSDTPGSLCNGPRADADAGQVSADGRVSQRLSEAPTSDSPEEETS